VLGGMKKGAILVDHTTASADVGAQGLRRGEGEGHRLHRCAGLRRPGGAENGKLTVMCGGERRPSSAPSR
jgi:3-hydroxyisobutyrate dehydrogenase-like beta-hydroxyacid dehydrogenase